jgi:polysaccharide deacetylase family protein (PEP-CTERM system associated)
VTPTDPATRARRGRALSGAVGEPRSTTAMSIDVEDWFHVANLGRIIRPHTWPERELRVEKTMDHMLQLMEQWNVKATCFVLGWVAERLPHLVRRVADAGHEIASHGYGHELVYDMQPTAFRRDITRSKQFLEDITGRRVFGYRAPNFSITDWAIPILQEVGFTYDSSLFPTTIAHDRYGRPTMMRMNGKSIVTYDGVAEVGLSCLTVGGHAMPWAGGGYFRLLPYEVFRAGVRRILASGRPYVFYIHPWELDPGQPRVAGLTRGERFRHYLNIERTEARWVSLMSDFEWVTISKLLHVVQRGSTHEPASPRAAHAHRRSPAPC